MNKSINLRRAVPAMLLIAAILMSGLPLFAQEQIVVSDITGGSSVFVFRGSQKTSTRKFVTQTRTKRTAAQRLESAKKINTQYVALAKVKPRRARTESLDPNKLPPEAKIKTMPRDQASKLFAGVGEWYIDRVDADHATDFFRTAYALDDKNSIAKNGLSEALALKGNDLLVSDKTDGAKAAKAAFDEALKYNPNNGVAYYGLGEIYDAQEKNDDAIASYEQALKLDSALTEIYVPLGVLYYQKGEIAKADPLLTKALAMAPGDAETQFFLGLVRFAQNKNPEALTAFRAAKSIKPDYAEAFYYTGETLERLNKNSDAIKEFEQATTLKPAYFEAWFAKGSAYFAAENYTEAIKAYREAVRLKNNSAEAQANLGDAYRLSNDFKSAEGSYNIANSLSGGDKNFTPADTADIYNKIGFVIAKQCDAYAKSATRCGWQRATTALEKAVAISQSPIDYANLGWAYYNAAHNDLNENRPDEGRAKLIKARDSLLKAVDSNPEFVEGPLLNLGMVYNDLGDNQGAIDTLSKVGKKAPNWTFAINELGVAYLNSKNYKEASAQFRRVIDRDDKYAAAYYNLAKSEYLNGNIGEAKKAYQKLKGLDRPKWVADLERFTNGAIMR